MRSGTFSRVAVLAAIAVIAAAGLCLLDGSDALSEDLCLSFFATTSALLPAMSLALMGRYLPFLRPPYHSLSSDLPAPPPKA